MLITPCALFAQDPGQAGRDAAAQAMGTYGNISGLSENVFKPLQGQVDMSTLDGSKTFSSQITCSQAMEFLQVDMFRGPMNDISALNVHWDSDLDGTMDSSRELTAFTEHGTISGVCNNGIISCEEGTWDNCRGYKVEYSSGSFGLSISPVTNLEGCYCINDFCTNPYLTESAIMDTASSAVLNGFMDTHRSFSVSEIINLTHAVHFYGQEPTSCFSSNVNTLAGFFDNPFAIDTEAQTEAMTQSADSQSMHNLVNNAYANQVEPRETHTCTITRAINQSILDIYDIIEPIGGSGSLAVVNTCGQFCIDIIIGQPYDNWLCGACGLWEGSYDFYMHLPNKISNATLLDVYYDDHMQIWIGDLTTVSTTGYCGPAPECVWYGPHDAFPPETPEGCCEHSTNFHQNPNLDVSSYFQTAGPLQTKVRVGYSGCGEGYAHIRLSVTDWCEWSEAMQDNCQVYEADINCQIKDETVDSVPTIINFSTTGKASLPSPVSVCNQNIMRDWYVRERTYMCDVSQSFDFTDVKQRLATIAQRTSRTDNTFSYGDYSMNPEGQWTSYTSGTLTMQPPPEINSCVQVCRVKVAASDTHASSTGNTSSYNLSNQMNEYSYKNCDNGTCGVKPGETLVDDCSCQTNFNEAFTAMQLLRLAGEDVECAPY